MRTSAGAICRVPTVLQMADYAEQELRRKAQ